jgi:4-amino-4-deoxy-L-arabinose transferase-like glycosyltransferase
MTAKQYRLFTILFFLAFAAGTLALSRVRPLDGDEGYYASAARLVDEGEAIYQDFFYPQMPLLPYVYAPVYKVVGSSLMNMRLLSVALGVLSLFLWWLVLRRRWPDRPGVILAGLVLVAANPYFLSWNVTVKTYALTNLAVFAAVWALDRGLESRRLGWFLLAGSVAGLGVGVRLLYLPWAGVLAVVVGWLQLRGTGKKVQLGSTGAYLGGLAVGLAPAAVFFLRDADRFIFNNLSYHQLRFSHLDKSGGTLGDQVALAFQALGKALFLNPFMFFQMVLVSYGIDWAWRHRDSKAAPLLVISGVGALTHTAAGMFPDPVYEQYFTGPLTPLLAPLVVAGLVNLVDLLKRRGPVLTGVLVLAVILSAVDLQVRKTGMDWREVWSFEHLAKVSAAIESHTESDDMVLALWPGYVFESGRRYLPGLENHFAVGVSEKLTIPEKIQYHIAGKELILKAFDEQHPNVVVLGAWMYELNTTIDQKYLPIILEELDTKYKLEEVFGESKVLTRKTAPQQVMPAE